MSSKPEDYLGACGTQYVNPYRIGWTNIPVLPDLIGRKWDALALAYCHSLRPSYIRVSTDEITTDGRTWRVTVMIDKEGIIKSITQEVEVGLLDDCRHGWDMECTLKGIPKPIPTIIEGSEIYIFNNFPQKRDGN